MDHGNLIRKLREERGLSQVDLSDNITHRTTLISFENKGSHVSFDTLLKYLNRMNISIEEYEFLYEKNTISAKDTVKDEFQQLINKKELSPDLPIVLTRYQQYLNKYHATGDFLYYSLYAQLFLIANYRARSLDIHSANVEQIKATLQQYLLTISNWGRFELVLFTNCMFIFETEFIASCLRTTIKAAYFYHNSNYYQTDLKILYINVLTLMLDRREYNLFNQLFTEFKNISTSKRDVELKIYIQIFNLIKSKIEGNEKTPDDQLFEHLKWLGMEEWITYIKSITDAAK
jgi:transcriptional activator, Rgg/GadR/MutR family, C-terminal domain